MERYPTGKKKAGSPPQTISKHREKLNGLSDKTHLLHKENSAAVLILWSPALSAHMFLGSSRKLTLEGHPTPALLPLT